MRITKRQRAFLTVGILLIVLTSVLFITLRTAKLPDKQKSYAVETIISPIDLLAGDIVFWKLHNTDNRAGHIAVITTASDIAKDIRISHATDHPDYNAFVETYLQPTEKIQKQNVDRYYYVIRIRDTQTKKYFLSILNEWLSINIPFNSTTEDLMNKWDDSMVAYSTEVKVQLQNQLFIAKNNIVDVVPPEGYMCSEVIITALQKAFIIKYGSISKLPNSLQLDSSLCPPSTMMLALSKDQKNFQILGELIMPNFTFTQNEKELHDTLRKVDAPGQKRI